MDRKHTALKIRCIRSEVYRYFEKKYEVSKWYFVLAHALSLGIKIDIGRCLPTEYYNTHEP